jgi:hypothetical protein
MTSTNKDTNILVHLVLDDFLAQLPFFWNVTRQSRRDLVFDKLDDFLDCAVISAHDRRTLTPQEHVNVWSTSLKIKQSLQPNVMIPPQPQTKSMLSRNGPI